MSVTPFNIQVDTIDAQSVETICWFNNSIVDWVNAGKQYYIDGSVKQLGRYSFHYKFDASITSTDGKYVLLYERLGTKALLLKNGELLREINRSYYCAETYEYPAVFITRNGVTYLIHCPLDYCRLDFENVETGELVTDIQGRDPSDVFYSRLEINNDGSFLMSKGWYWHPREAVEVFNVDDCFKNPLLLDKSTLYPDIDVEVCTASFIDDSKVLIGSSDEAFDEEINTFPIKSIAIWDISSNEILNPVKVNGEFGNVFSINSNFAWDMYKYPKIIAIETGDIVSEEKTIDSGNQSSSIMGSVGNKPQIIFNRETKQVAVAGKEKIIIFTPPESYL